jgi:hypothetical protein
VLADKEEKVLSKEKKEVQREQIPKCVESVD